MTTALDRTLVDVLRGDVTAIADLENTAPALLAEGTHGAHLVLDSGAVASVLTRYLAGEVASVDAQRWAALMRWGCVAGRSDQALDIDYEPSHEDAIIAVLARLDELGDQIDGDITRAEADEMLRHLG